MIDTDVGRVPLDGGISNPADIPFARWLTGLGVLAGDGILDRWIARCGRGYGLRDAADSKNGRNDYTNDDRGRRAPTAKQPETTFARQGRRGCWVEQVTPAVPDDLSDPLGQAMNIRRTGYSNCIW